MDDELIRRAHELGAVTEYWNVQGELCHAEETSLRTVVEMLADDAARHTGRRLPPIVIGTDHQFELGPVTDVQLVLADGTEVRIEPADGRLSLPDGLPLGCHTLHADVAGRIETTTVVIAPSTMPADPRLDGGAGLFVPLYALWTEDAPLSSFGHLRRLGQILARRGVSVLSTLPLYATFLDDPFDPSPYAPVSRLHWNEVYLDDDTLPAADDPTRTTITDWRELARRRRLQLLAAARELDAPTTAALEQFLERCPDVRDYAKFRAMAPSPIDREFPAGLVQASHALAQMLADEQLARVEGPDTTTLALDLPIGASSSGYESWAFGDRLAAAKVGAPPDPFMADGQDWGFPPQLPFTSRATGHELWRRLVRRAGTHCSMLRIDHILGVERLWWIPHGCDATQGVYVKYPREELLAVIAAEAAFTNTTIVGENLGTVPDEVVEALERWDVVGMYAEQFNLWRHDLDHIPPRSVAAIRTHDMPAFAAAVTDDHADPAGYAWRLGHEAGVEVPVSAGPMLEAAMTRLGRSDAFLTMADLDDLSGETAPHNVPGWELESIWRRRLAQPYPDLLDEPVVEERLHLHAHRRGAATDRQGRHDG